MSDTSATVLTHSGACCGRVVAILGVGGSDTFGTLRLGKDVRSVTPTITVLPRSTPKDKSTDGLGLYTTPKLKGVVCLRLLACGSF